VCDNIAQGCYLKVERPEVEPATFCVASEHLNHYITRSQDSKSHAKTAEPIKTPYGMEQTRVSPRNHVSILHVVGADWRHLANTTDRSVRRRRCVSRYHYCSNLFMSMSRCLESSQSDYIEFSNFNVPLTDRKMARLCGAGSFHSVLSDGTFFRVTFVSNDIFDGTGFRGRYEFRLHRQGNDTIRYDTL